MIEATGNNGHEIVKLLSRTGVRCRALVRSSEKSGALANLPGVRLVYARNVVGSVTENCNVRLPTRHAT